MDVCAQPRLLTLSDALQHMRAAMTPLHQTLECDLLDALDCVLADAIESPIAVPGFNNSAMDGYALRSEDARECRELTIIGEVLAGQVFAGALQPGECVRIMTGARVPAGADAVVMQERVSREGNRMVAQGPVKAGENLRLAGEDIQRGETVLTAGQRLTAIDIGLLASLGIDRVRVARPLKIAIFSTGNELTPLGHPLADGKIYDSNRYGLMALLRRINAEVVDLGLLPDVPEQIDAAFVKALTADVVITTGGVSVGDADYIKSVLEQRGHINFWKVAIKPGKPFAFGELPAPDGRPVWFFGLPGNPVSAVVTYHQLVLPLLRHLQGEAPPAGLTLPVRAASALNKQPGRMDFQRGIVQVDGDTLTAVPTGQQGSGILTSMARANAYLVLEQERGKVEAGETLWALPFDRFIQ